MPFDTGRRLCLLVEAGGGRYAIEASSVLEVFLPQTGKGPRGLELEDLSGLLGGPVEPQPEAAVVLDTSPTLAVRVRRVLEVADVAQAPVFQLPPGLGERLAPVVRGALLYGGRLFLELSPDALGGPVGASVPPRPIYLLEEPPDRALIFRSQGRSYGIPLAWVSQVVAWDDAFCPLPRRGPAAGLHPHGQALWPIYALSALLGESAERESLLLLTDLAGQAVGLSAQGVEGVKSGLRATGLRGEFAWKESEPAALFLDLQRMFS